MNDDMHHTSSIDETVAKMATNKDATRRLSWDHRLQLYMHELPAALSLSILTAITTLVLAIVLSALLGQANEDHRVAQRCFANETINLIHEIVANSPTLSEKIDLSKYPTINIDGTDCALVFEGE